MTKIISVILLGVLISLASCGETASKTSVEPDTTVEVINSDVIENSSSLNTEASTKSAFEAALPSTSLPLTTQAPQTTTTKTAQTTTTQSVGTTSKESIFERDKYFFMNAQSDNLRSQYPIASNVRFYTDESHNDYYFKDVDGTNDKLIAFKRAEISDNIKAYNDYHKNDRKIIEAQAEIIAKTFANKFFDVPMDSYFRYGTLQGQESVDSEEGSIKMYVYYYTDTSEDGLIQSGEFVITEYGDIYVFDYDTWYEEDYHVGLVIY